MSEVLCVSSSAKKCTRQAKVKGLCPTCYNNQWAKNNRKKVNKSRKGYWKDRFNNDDQYRIKSKVRASTSNALRRNLDTTQIKYVGCTPFELKEYLSAQFTEAMSFDNYASLWEVDHIIPLSKFDITDPAQLAVAANYTNLRPRLIVENRMQKNEKHSPKIIESEKGVA